MDIVQDNFCLCLPRSEPGSAVDLCDACWVFPALRGPADVSRLSIFHAGYAAVHCAPQCRGRGQPAAFPGPHGPQPATGHTVTG